MKIKIIETSMRGGCGGIVSGGREYVDRAAVESEIDERDKRIAELEAFVAKIEHLQTEWVTGTTPANECMIAVSEAWEQVRDIGAQRCRRL